MSDETKLKCVSHQRTVTLKVSLESGQMISTDIKAENLIPGAAPPMPFQGIGRAAAIYIYIM